MRVNVIWTVFCELQNISTTITIYEATRLNQAQPDQDQDNHENEGKPKPQQNSQL